MTKIGKKTLSLQKIINAGFNVPSFFVVSAEEVGEIYRGGKIDNDELGKLVEKIKNGLVCERYAVRSSALIEDTKNQSYAGQFKTVIDQRAEQLEAAVREVLDHAYKFLRGEIEKFSLLVQEYIDEDFSGILFTRNPLGGREAVIEYHKGIGEDIVSGKIKPEKCKFYLGQEQVKVRLPGFDEVRESFKRIEDLFKFPQDIEWCVRKGKWYFLQSRPITTISAEQYEEYLFLDGVLPRGRDYIFEKTEISEIAARPTPFTYSLLKMIYAKGGAVDNVYKKYKVRYSSENFLKIVGNELYVDREKEIKTLLPAYGYLKSANFKPGFVSFFGLWITIRNFFYLNKISLSKYEELFGVIKERLGAEFSHEAKFKERLEIFLKDYELIFEINLLADKAIKGLTQALKRQYVSVAAVLANNFGKEENVILFDGAGLKGNCLEIGDEIPFDNSHGKLSKNEDVQKWFSGLSDLKKKFFEPIIAQAQKYNRLREYGRWLTVKNVNYLRKVLKGKDDYFATIEELLEGKRGKAEGRKSEYEIYMKYELPSKLLSRLVSENGVLLGVSVGIAEGVLVDLNGISDGGASGSVGKILYTRLLSPDLTQYFGKINGIISEQGGLLSHLAIMARENKIPVVVNFNLGGSGLKIGDRVRIDGGKGIVENFLRLS